MFRKQLWSTLFLTLLVEQCIAFTPAKPTTNSTTNPPTNPTIEIEDLFDGTTLASTTEYPNVICSHNSDCRDQYIENSFCSEGKCKCKLGYVTYLNSSRVCSEVKCFSNWDCSELNPLTICNSVPGTCVCKPDFYLDLKTQKCEVPYTIQNVCDADSDCAESFGFYSHCLNGWCECNFGYRLKNGHCTKETCVQDSDCSRSHTQCTDGVCSACADSYYYYNTSTQSCERISWCLSDLNCIRQVGSDSMCFDGTCKCKLGYRLLAGKCTQTECKSDRECTAHFTSTHCNYLGKCVCDDGSELNLADQTCYPEKLHDFPATVALPVLFVVLCIFVLFITVYRTIQSRSPLRRAQHLRSLSRFQLSPSDVPSYPNRGPPPTYTPSAASNQSHQTTLNCPTEPRLINCQEDQPPPYSEAIFGNNEHTNQQVAQT